MSSLQTGMEHIMIRTKIVIRDPKDSVSSWAGRFDRITASPPMLHDAKAAGFPATAIKVGFSMFWRNEINSLKAKLTSWCEATLPLADFFICNYNEGVVLMFTDESHMALFKLYHTDEYEISLDNIGRIK
jgi:hypothetical protein